MGYSLMFYSLDWDALCHELRAQRPELMKSVRESHWVQQYPEKGPEEVDAAWARACKELSKKLSAGHSQPHSSAEIKGEAGGLFLALVEHLGQNLGFLDHASASGEEFREDFLGNVAARFFEAPDLMDWLTCRPICDLISAEPYPSWGGIHRTELLPMRRAHDRKQNDMPDTGDDSDIWLEELAQLIQDAQRERRDLVTLYL